MEYTIHEVVTNLIQDCPNKCAFCIVNSRFSFNGCNPYVSKGRWISVLKELLNSQEIKSLNLSGGDPLNYNQTREIIKEVYSDSRSGIYSISTTGFDYEKKINFLENINYKGIIELTLDYPHQRMDKYRPYLNVNNFEFALKLKERGFKVSIMTVIRKDNIEYLLNKELYKDIRKIEPESWHLIPYYKNGRGINLDLLPSIEDLLNLKEKTKYPDIKIKFQHSFLYLIKDKNFKCEIPYQIGILYNGDVVLCPWGLDRHGIGFKWNYISNIMKSDLKDILKTREKILNKMSSRGFKFCRSREYVNEEKS